MAQRLSGPDLLSLARAAESIPPEYISPTYHPNLEAESGQRTAAQEISVAIGKLLSDLGLDRRLSDFNVPKKDLEGIAEKVAVNSKVYDKDMVLSEILLKVY
jgi:alcohol dehydrogenase class IV